MHACWCVQKRRREEGRGMLRTCEDASWQGVLWLDELSCTRHGHLPVPSRRPMPPEEAAIHFLESVYWPALPGVRDWTSQ